MKETREAVEVLSDLGADVPGDGVSPFPGEFSPSAAGRAGVQLDSCFAIEPFSIPVEGLPRRARSILANDSDACADVAKSR